MSRFRLGASSRIKMFTILATCLGLMAIASSSASAATPVKYTFTATAKNAIVYSGGNGGVTCEALTLTGQETAPIPLGSEPITGTVTGLTSTNCVNTFWKTPVTYTLKTPWTLSTFAGTTTVSGVNLHGAVAAAPAQLYWDMTSVPLKFNTSGGALGASTWRFTNQMAMTVKPFGGTIGAGFAAEGKVGYVEASFVFAYRTAS